MRGRTNIAGGDVVVNGELKEFTVAEGNTIGKGDFVQYGFVSNYNYELFDNNFNRYSVQIDGTHQLIAWQNGNTETWNTFAGIFEYKNEELKLVSSPLPLQNIRISWQNNQAFIGEINGKKYFAFGGVSESGNDNIAIVIEVDLTNLALKSKYFNPTLLSAEFGDSIETCSVATYKGTQNEFLFCFSVNIFITSGQDAEVGTETVYHKVEITQSEDGFELAGTRIGRTNDKLDKDTYITFCNFSSNESSSVVGVWKGRNNTYNPHSKFSVYSVGKEAGSLTKLRELSITLYASGELTEGNVTDGVIYVSQKAQYGDNAYILSENGIISTLPNDDFYELPEVEKIYDGCIAIYYNKDGTTNTYMKILNYNKEMQTHELSNEFAFPSKNPRATNSGGIMTIGGNKYLMLVGKGYYCFTYENDTITDGTESHWIVAEYEKGNALGFAKTGGTEGQTIKVYVPWGTT